MPGFFLPLIFFPSVFFLASCQNGHSSLSIMAIDSAGFRRSYAGHEKWTEEEEQKRTNCNPQLLENISPVLYNKLNGAGVMKSDSLLLPFFKSRGSFIIGNGRNQLTADAGFQNNYSEFLITVHNGSESACVAVKTETHRFEFGVADVVPGGYPEILLLENGYIMNGDNYFVRIYEVKQGRSSQQR
jgi:hypothetical protein